VGASLGALRCLLSVAFQQIFLRIFPSSMKPQALRVYSQNVCILPVGGRERLLQPSSLFGTFLLLLLLFHYNLPHLLLFLLPTSLFCPLAYLLAFPLWGGSNLFAHDYKAERLEELADRVTSKHTTGKQTSGKYTPGQYTPRYEVLLLQEFFGTYYSDRHRQQFARLLRDRGYKHHAMPPSNFLSILPR